MAHRARHRARRGLAAASLKGIEKAAVLLVAVGEERAERDLPPPRRQRGRGALARDRQVAQGADRASARDVLGEAVETVLAEDYIAEGGVDYARSILERSLGAARAEEIIGRLSATIERRPFEFLRRTPPEQIHVFLRNEAPQTIALVIANLHTTLAAAGALAAWSPRSRPTSRAASPRWPRRAPRSSRRSRT